MCQENEGVKMDSQRIISVSKNINSMEKYYYGEETKEDMIEWRLSESEFKSLFESGVFDLLNNYCESLIDDFESETIGSDKFNLAETTVINLKSKTNNKEIEKLHVLIQEAIKRGTQISFDF